MINSFVIVSDHHLLKNIGGAEVQADLLAQYLTKYGVKVTYLSKDIDSKMNYKGYDLIPLPQNKKELNETLFSLNADVYYQRGRKKLTGDIARFCKKNNKKFVFASSMDIDCQLFKFFLRGKKNYSYLEILKNLKKNIISIFIDVYSIWGIKQAHLVLTQTNIQKQLLKERTGIKSTVFFNMHPLPEQLDDPSVNDRTETTRILWLANLKSWKQPEIFLKLVEELAEEKLEFYMAGHIKKNSYEKLIKKAEEINSNFKYLGGLTLDESNDVFHIADIFVNTSKEQEGFPNTFIQAWLTGIPVISLNFDPDNIIQNHELGYVSNSYENLLKHVLDLSNDIKKRNEMGRKAKNFAYQNFSIEKNIQSFIDLVSIK